jgi:hypothetical protein
LSPSDPQPIAALKAPLTLPGLQRQLDLLRPGQELTIAGSTCRHLFGETDRPEERIMHFAAGHRCTIRHCDHAVTFHKKG